MGKLLTHTWIGPTQRPNYQSESTLQHLNKPFMHKSTNTTQTHMTIQTPVSADTLCANSESFHSFDEYQNLLACSLFEHSDMLYK